MTFFRLTRRLGAALLLALPLAAFVQTPGVGIGTTTSDVSAALDIVSSSKGALLPRVAAATALATGLLGFQTNSPAGYYYNPAAQTAADHASLLTLPAPMARLLGGQPTAAQAPVRK